MMSVGAEKDPYLHAYIQARMKNHVEEVKLQKVLANLEVGRRIKKIMLNMELFEDRKMAHKLKQEATDAETNKKNAMKKFLNSQKKSHRSKKDTFYTGNITAQSIAITVETAAEVRTAPTSSTTKRAAIYPVTKGNSRAMSPVNLVPTVSSASRVELRRTSSIEPPNNTTAMTVSNSLNNNSVKIRELTTPLRRENSISVFNNNNSTVGNSNEEKLSASFRRTSHTMPHLSTPVVQVEVIDAEGIKTPATIPMRRTQRATDTRSVRTLPILLHSQSSMSMLASKPGRPQTSKLWPGDPDAIRSVRRERRKPEEMLSLVKNGDEARRMIRDMPPNCSKNCSKPDILQELGRSYSDLPNLLPAIEKARHAFAQKEAASRDVPPEHSIEEATPNEVFPVSQIQYMALRSMGGVRRNSVIV